MYFTAVESDQLYTWSDENTEAAHRRTAETPQRSPAPIASAQAILRGSLIERYKRCGKPGCKCADGAGHGPKYYLSVSYPGITATNGLCAAGISRANGGVPVELPPSPRDLRSDLRDQPRTAAPSRGALKGCHERSTLRPPRIDRCKIGRRASRQYARRLARRQPRGSFNCGDSR